MFLIILFIVKFLQAANISNLYNTPDPFGPHSAKTSNIYTLSAAGDDTETAIYSNFYIT